MHMKNPPHPGRILKEECFEPIGLTITEAALKLGVSRQTLSEVVNGKAGISPLMALKLGKALNTTPEFWLNAQKAVDIYEAYKETKKLPKALLVNDHRIHV